MIISLLQVGLLTMGVGVKASTPIYLNEQPQETTINQEENILTYRNNANETQDYTMYFSTSVNSHNDNTDTNPTPIGQATTGMQLRTGKTKYNEVSNDALSINSISYGSNYRTSNGSSWNTTYGILTNTYRDYRRATCAFGAYKFTPYILNIDNEVNLKLNTNVLIGAANRELILRTEFYITQDQNAATYYDIANWNTQYYLWDAFDTLNSSQYTGQYSYHDQAVTTGALSQTYTEDIDITIPYIKENNAIQQTYLFTRSYIYLVHKSGSADSITTYNIDMNEPIQNATGHTITGTMVVANVNIEVVDIPGLLWEILSMPFAFISTAFNLTLFPGTQYQVNISNLILTIFGVLVFIFIFKMLLKK